MGLPYGHPISFRHVPRCPGFFSGKSSVSIDGVITGKSIVPGGYLKRNELAQHRSQPRRAFLRDRRQLPA